MVDQFKWTANGSGGDGPFVVSYDALIQIGSNSDKPFAICEAPKDVYDMAVLLSHFVGPSGIEPETLSLEG